VEEIIDKLKKTDTNTEKSEDYHYKCIHDTPTIYVYISNVKWVACKLIIIFILYNDIQGTYTYSILYFHNQWNSV